MSGPVPANAAVDTYPFCGACGWDVVASPNLNADTLCDACGADLISYWVGLAAPAAPVGTPAVGEVSFAWTSNPGADSDETSVSDDDLATWSVFAADTSPTVVTATTGTVVGIRVRSVLGGIKGDYVEASDTTG